MNCAKYITYLSDKGVPAILIFPCYLQHADVAAGKQVLGAGFVDLAARRCHGESISLNIGPSPRDNALLQGLYSDAAEVAA